LKKRFNLKTSSRLRSLLRKLQKLMKQTLLMKMKSFLKKKTLMRVLRSLLKSSPLKKSQ
jgi:hypothetical protein